MTSMHFVKYMITSRISSVKYKFTLARGIPFLFLEK